jgi:hypothetical protein
MNRALGGDELTALLQGNTKILRYKDLFKYKTIEQVLGKEGNAIILYPDKQNDINYGHWTAVFYSVNDNNDTVIEFFDPYGICVDNELKVAGVNYPNYLSHLLSKTRFPIEYNDLGFQKLAHNIATCGRHVVTRLRHANLSINNYMALLDKYMRYINSHQLKNKKKLKNFDELVVYLTE